MSHTKEPWEYVGESTSLLPFVVTDALGKREAFAIDTDNGDNDARRIVACVNACRGISNEDLVMDNVHFVKALRERTEYKERSESLQVRLDELLRIIA